MELHAPTTEATAKNIQNPLSDSNNVESFSSTLDDLDSSCSTPYVSAPSSPGHGGSGGGGGFFYSAPASPMHFAMHSIISRQSSSESNATIDFEFSARFGSSGSGPTGSMSSADELFLNGQIRPMKLSSHLERPQVLAPLLDLDDDEAERGRDSRVQDRSLRRRARSMSPLRHAPPQRLAGDEESRENKNGSDENEDAATPSASASSSRSSSAGRSSKRWVFLKEFLRSKSEGRSNNKFWATISFSPAGKEKKPPTNPNLAPSAPPPEQTQKPKTAKKPANGLGKRRVPLSAHELHYTTKRAQAEELRKRTYLPYRQGLLGCLGFSSKGYGAMNGFARALNPVSSSGGRKMKIFDLNKKPVVGVDLGAFRLRDGRNMSKRTDSAMKDGEKADISSIKSAGNMIQSGLVRPPDGSSLPLEEVVRRIGAALSKEHQSVLGFGISDEDKTRFKFSHSSVLSSGLSETGSLSGHAEWVGCLS